MGGDLFKGSGSLLILWHAESHGRPWWEGQPRDLPQSRQWSLTGAFHFSRELVIHARTHFTGGKCFAYWEGSHVCTRAVVTWGRIFLFSRFFCLCLCCWRFKKNVLDFWACGLFLKKHGFWVSSEDFSLTINVSHVCSHLQGVQSVWVWFSFPKDRRVCFFKKQLIILLSEKQTKMCIWMQLLFFPA